MTSRPGAKRAVAFFDGQNLFYSVKEAFGYSYPNYDPLALAKAVAGLKGWNLVKTFFYTGIPDAKDDPKWNRFWTAKLASMGKRGIKTFSRHLKYRNQTVALPDGKAFSTLVGQEKGVDIRIALDIVGMALRKEYDAALIFSQDQDLSEAADDVRQIAKTQKRSIDVLCAFPVSPASHNVRGINNTDWIKIDRAVYDLCKDPNDYRPKTEEETKKEDAPHRRGRRRNRRTKR